MALPKRRIKTQEQRKIEDKIFDELLLKDLFYLKSKGYFEDYYKTINEGKESKILLVGDKEGNARVLKIYKIEAGGFRNMWKYLKGDERFNKIKQNRRDIIYAWTKKEYHNLKIINELGIPSPIPFFFIRNILVMSFLGKDKI